jgi:hypothetical protein
VACEEDEARRGRQRERADDINTAAFRDLKKKKISGWQWRRDTLVFYFLNKVSP